MDDHQERLEPRLVDVAVNLPGDTGEQDQRILLVSIAISLKRIADRLDRIHGTLQTMGTD